MKPAVRERCSIVETRGTSWLGQAPKTPPRLMKCCGPTWNQLPGSVRPPLCSDGAPGAGARPRVRRQAEQPQRAARMRRAARVGGGARWRTAALRIMQLRSSPAAPTALLSALVTGGPAPVWRRTYAVCLRNGTVAAGALCRTARATQPTTAAHMRGALAMRRQPASRLAAASAGCLHAGARHGCSRGGGVTRGPRRDPSPCGAGSVLVCSGAGSVQRGGSAVAACGRAGAVVARARGSVVAAHARSIAVAAPRRGSAVATRGRGCAVAAPRRSCAVPACWRGSRGDLLCPAPVSRRGSFHAGSCAGRRAARHALDVCRAQLRAGAGRAAGVRYVGRVEQAPRAREKVAVALPAPHMRQEHRHAGRACAPAPCPLACRSLGALSRTWCAACMGMSVTMPASLLPHHASCIPVSTSPDGHLEQGTVDIAVRRLQAGESGACTKPSVRSPRAGLGRRPGRGAGRAGCGAHRTRRAWPAAARTGCGGTRRRRRPPGPARPRGPRAPRGRSRPRPAPRPPPSRPRRRRPPRSARCCA